LGIFVFQVPFQLADPLSVGLVFVLTLVALYTMGMLFASIFMLYGREAWNTANLLQEPVYFLSGAYFPSIYAPVVPFALQAAGSLIPMTIGLDAIRSLAINGESIATVWPHILALIACTLILFPLATPPRHLAWLIVGNAFYAFVLQIMLGMAILVHVDRTRYEVLKNIYISPGTLHPYVIGRGLVSVVNGAVSVILTLLFSVAIFNGLLHMNIPLNLLNVNLLMLFPAVILGIISLLAIGYMLCAVNIVSNRMEFILGDSVSGIFFLLGGVIFPIALLPSYVQPISNVLPLTHLLNAVRETFGLLPTAS